MSARQELIQRFHDDRPLAHAVLFEHRHPSTTPDFQIEMQRDFHSPRKHVLDMVFRGGGKSTTAEEALLLMAQFREFKNGIIVGSNKDRAQERLHAIRHEAETNDTLRKVFGEMVGVTWGDAELVFANGARILAMGKGQSMRGIKFEDVRPDMVMVDDLEERQDVASPEGRKKNLDWLTLDLLPACDPNYRVRVQATPLHPEAVPMILEKDREWLTHKYPLYYLNEDGGKTSSWPDRFPIKFVLELEESYRQRGQLQGFRQEYMCESEAPETKTFKPDMIHVAPRVRTWQAVYSMTDPARTTLKTSATTGHAVWSWIGSKLVIWDGWARRIMPDDIVKALFDTDVEFSPVWIGFEEDGLNQWALQSIRQEMVKRGVAIPLKPLKAPAGKLDFIRGLQPFFTAREVEFATACPELKSQLLGFPNGDIDAPNALAYALKMRPGAPIYDDFGGRHVAEDIIPSQGSPLWLCLNATHTCVTGVLLQVGDGGVVRIYADYVREGDPAAVTSDVIAAARLEAGNRIRLAAGPIHFDRYNNVGLTQAIAKLPAEVHNGVLPADGRDFIRKALRQERQGMPALMISSEATWTLRAMSGGYSRALLKQGILADYAEDSVYRVLMEGVESFCGLLEFGLGDGNQHARFNAETSQGRPYRSMIAGDRTVRESKEDWNALLRGER